MDQDTLVDEQIDAGARFIAGLDKVMPVKVAIWLKVSGDTRRHLHLASERTDSATAIHEGYQNMGRVLDNMPEPKPEAFRVKLIAADNPLAPTVVAIQQQYTSSTSRKLFRDCEVAGRSVEELYVYPAGVAVASSYGLDRDGADLIKNHTQRAGPLSLRVRRHRSHGNPRRPIRR